MRFRWVPKTSDSVYPFILGLLEFMLIETLGPDDVGLWFICLALIFASMTWVGHQTMRRARRDGENDAFFAEFERARLRDFRTTFIIIGAWILAGVYLLATGNRGLFTMLALLATIGVLAWQFYQTAVFWDRSVADDAEQE